jgi:hypothetical protein
MDSNLSQLVTATYNTEQHSIDEDRLFRAQLAILANTAVRVNLVFTSFNQNRTVAESNLPERLGSGDSQSAVSLLYRRFSTWRAREFKRAHGSEPDFQIDACRLEIGDTAD